MPVLLIVAACLASAPPSAAVGAEADGEWMEVIRPRINFRAGPSKRQQIIAVLREGSRVQVTARRGRWLRAITEEGTEGWLHSRLVRPAPDPLAVLRGEIAIIVGGEELVRAVRATGAPGTIEIFVEPGWRERDLEEQQLALALVFERWRELLGETATPRVFVLDDNGDVLMMQAGF